MKKYFKIYIFFTFFLFSLSQSPASPLSQKDVPEVLRPWTLWVMHGFEEYECPFSHTNEKERYCQWAHSLSLELSTRGGQFEQQWRVWADGWIELPGSSQHWPQDVSLNDSPALVVNHSDYPGIWVKAGTYVVTGSFYWQEIPQTLTIPHKTALISLLVNSQNVEFPHWTEDGKLWLRPETTAQDRDDVRDRLDLKVYRHIIDDIPLKAVTHIDLNVSGKDRDILLSHALLEHFIPLYLNSPLPVRLEPQGGLRVQVRPGQWSIIVTARYPGPVNSLSFPSSTDETWTDEEVWVFESLSRLRLVQIQGVTAIDPQQTTLPDTWRHLPAYLVHQGDEMKIIEKKRGDPEPAPDYLTLYRKIWLDFDGQGYTIEDRINGTMWQSWRLEMNPPFNLGRAAVNNKDQFITRLEGSDRSGVEVRRGEIDLAADSRLDNKKREFPIVGWSHDFQEVKAELNLPPGWRLFNAAGVDHVPFTWLKKWTLLDIFVILIITLSLARLKGWPLAVLALVTLTLIYHEPDAPQWVWLHLLASAALLRVLPQGWFWRSIRLYYYISIASLIIISIPFMINQVRIGLYPPLEMPWHTMDHAPQAPASTAVSGAVNETSLMEEQAPREDYELSNITDALSKDKSSYRPKRKGKISPQKQAIMQNDPNAVIQTGPGLPKWQWKKYIMSWNGPVKEHEKLSLVLISPRITMIILFIQVILLSLLILTMFDITMKKRPSQHSSRVKKSSFVGAIVIVSLLMIFSAGNLEADIPSPELLKDLQSRLLEKPDCLPLCASSPRVSLEVTPDNLRLRMEIHSYDTVAVPLPGHEKHWLPHKILLNGKPAGTLMRTQQGSVQIALPQGIHQITMEGPLDKRQEVQISLPLKPHQVKVQASGWTVEGIDKGRVPGNHIYLRRMSENGQTSSLADVEGTTLPPFVLVERTLILGLIWEVETRVIRNSPEGPAIALEVPLLQGESITTENIRVENQKAFINLSGHEKVVSWRSLFEKSEHIELKAPDTLNWTESWKLNVSPIWHVNMKGISVIHHTDSGGQWLPQWRPWPGESVSLTITRPEGVEGQTVTIDSTHLSITPGFRATDVTLLMSIRSSQGVQHTVTLPENVELQSVTINGKTQPIRQEQRSVTLPLVPGSQSIELTWRHSQGISRLFETPLVDIGKSSVNTQIHLSMPRSQWVLFTGGPYMGPAVLFWGVLAVIVLISLILGRVKSTPLKTYQWLLLGIGLTQAPVVCAFIVAGWFFAFAWRKQFNFDTRDKLFDFTQIGLTFLTLMAVISLFYAIKLGLLGHPNMQIGGNGSTAYSLRWFQDISKPLLPQSWVFSVPLMVYRIAMLLWSLWLSFALLKWMRWGWSCFSEGGVWRTFRLRKKK